MTIERITEIIYKNSHDCSEGLIINFENIQKVINLLHEKELEETFEQLLVEQFAICELRDFWRKKAGLPLKCIEDES